MTHAKRPEVRFVVVGDGELRPQLEKEIQERGLKDVLFLPGWRRDMPRVLARADAFVMTSLWEGLPRALLEAMAAGLPCVANAVDGVTDVIRDGVSGFLVPPKRPEETARRLLELLENPNRALEMGRRARASIGPEFDIDFMVRQQEDLYESLFVF